VRDAPFDTIDSVAEISEAAPNIELVAHDGSSWRLADHLGAPVMLVFHRHLR
jgi:peroxiredoxin